MPYMHILEQAATRQLGLFGLGVIPKSPEVMQVMTATVRT